MGKHSPYYPDWMSDEEVRASSRVWLWAVGVGAVLVLIGIPTVLMLAALVWAALSSRLF